MPRHMEFSIERSTSSIVIPWPSNFPRQVLVYLVQGMARLLKREPVTS
ncbi:hypothetical protein KRR40_20565 [Niabella defluvii]|nr:hypothetical protein KRR40_20565 [Niabella sp. I65]